MAALSYLKRAFDSSLYRRNSGNFVAFRFRFLNARVFSSLETAEDEARNRDELKRDRVRSLLNEYGFTHEQVTRVSSSVPSILTYNVETLSPKLAFLQSILGSDGEVPSVVAVSPVLLCSSLKNKLIPNHTFIKSILGKDELVAKCIRRCPRVLRMDIETNLGAKVRFFEESGVQSASIAKLMEYSPRMFGMPFCKFKDLLEKAMSFGFEPSNPMIVTAIRAVGQMNAPVWDQKVQVYRKWGWSNDDVRSAFRRHPFIMTLSEKKINKSLDVFVNSVGLSSSVFIKYPSIMLLSVEERIIPRCSVLALLFSKGVLHDKPSKASIYICALKLTEEAFVKRYVVRYPEHVLQLWLKLRRKDG